MVAPTHAVTENLDIELARLQDLRIRASAAFANRFMNNSEQLERLYTDRYGSSSFRDAGQETLKRKRTLALRAFKELAENYALSLDQMFGNSKGTIEEPASPFYLSIERASLIGSTVDPERVANYRLPLAYSVWAFYQRIIDGTDAAAAPVEEKQTTENLGPARTNSGPVTRFFKEPAKVMVRNIRCLGLA